MFRFFIRGALLSYLPNQCDQIGRYFALSASFKAFGNNEFAQFSCNIRQFLYLKVSKSIIFLVKSLWATFIDIWRFFLVTLFLTQESENEVIVNFQNSADINCKIMRLIRPRKSAISLTRLCCEQENRKAVNNTFYY